MKILVLERLNKSEEILNSYINQCFPKAEINIIYNCDKVENLTIIDAIKNCDIIVVQSIFDTFYEGIQGIQSFIKILNLFYNSPELRKPSYIIHSTGGLLQFFNEQLIDKYKNLLKEMLSDNLEVYNVYYQEFDNPKTKSTDYFKKPTIKKFSAIKIFYNKKENYIWDENIPYISPYSNTKLYKKEQLLIDKTDKQDIKEMLSEIKYIYNNILEDLENNIGYIPNENDENDKKEIQEEKNKKIKIINNLLINLS